jgi:hypothetical protein
MIPRIPAPKEPKGVGSCGRVLRREDEREYRVRDIE